MAVNANATLRVILDHPEIFFAMMDYAEGSTGRGDEEFSVAYYNHVVDETIKRSSADAARRIREALAIPNLDHAGLLDYEDGKHDTFLLKPFVVEMLRHLDKSRLKELSDSDLENLRAQLINLLDLLKAPDLMWFDDDARFTETIATVFDTVRTTLSRVKQNIEALRGQSLTLAEMVEKAEGASRTLQVTKALDKIYQINTRHIEPTLLFLNPTIDWKGKGNLAPMAVIGEILKQLRVRKRHAEYAVVNRAYLNILGYAEQISSIRRGLDSYLQLYDDQRKVYNNIEARYNDLLERVTALDNGKSRYRLKSTDEHFKLANGFIGLKDYRGTFSARLNWPDSGADQALAEFKRVRLESEKEKNPELRDTTPATGSAQKRSHSERLKRISAVAKKIRLNEGEDVYKVADIALNNDLEDYALSDLIDAVPFIKEAKGNISLGRRVSLTRGNRRLDYFERIYNVNTGKTI